MSNLTLVIDTELLRRARIKALEQGTSVNSVVRDLIEQYVGETEQTRARNAIVDSARQSQWGSENGRSWKREDLYRERMGRYEPVEGS